MAKGRIEVDQVIDPKLLQEIEATDSAMKKWLNTYLSLIKSVNDGNTASTNFSKTVSDIDAQMKQSIESETKLAAARDKVSKATKEYTQAQANAARAIKDARDLAQANAVINDKEAGTIEKSTAWIKRLTIERRKLNLETKGGQDKLIQINKELDKHNGILKNTADATLKQKQNIGNYKSALEGLGSELQSSTGKLGQFGATLAKLGPIGAGIAGIATIISAPFVAFFKLTENGMEMFERKIAGAKAAFSVLGGEIARIGEEIIGGDKGPIQWGNIFSKVTKTLLSTANIIPGVSKYVDQLGDKMNKSGATAEDFTRKMQDLEEAESKANVTRSEVNIELAKARLAYKDDAVASEEKVKALKQVIDLENKQAKIEEDLNLTRLNTLKGMEKMLMANNLTAEAEKLRYQIDDAQVKVNNDIAESTMRVAKNTGLLGNAIDEVNKKKKEGKEAALLPMPTMKGGEIEVNDDIDAQIDDAKYVSDAINDIADENLNKAIDRIEQVKQKEQELEELRISAQQAVTDVADALFQRKMDTLEQEKQAEIAAAGDNSAKREAIEKKYNRKIAEAKRKQAIWDKTNAVVQIGINTAVGISKAIPNLILMAIAGITGTAQLAIALAKKIPDVPAYFKGVFSHPGGYATVGEEGSELLTFPGGRQMITPDQPTLMNLPAGTQVMPNDVLSAELAGMRNTRGYIPVKLDLQREMLSALIQIRDNEQYDMGDYIVIKKGNTTTTIRKNR